MKWLMVLTDWDKEQFLFIKTKGIIFFFFYKNKAMVFDKTSLYTKSLKTQLNLSSFKKIPHGISNNKNSHIQQD